MSASPGPPEQDYAAAGLGGTLQAGRRPALLLVDPVRAYLDPECSLYAGVEEPVAAMRVLLAAARAARIPVAVTTVSLRADGSDGGVFARKVPAVSAFAAGSRFAAVAEGLEPGPGEVAITKRFPSAFFDTPLHAELTARGVDTLFIAGLSTSGCVRASALDAMQHGYVPIVVEDAVGDRDPGVHAANLFDVRHKIGEVWSLADAVAHLGASHPSDRAR